MNSACRAHDGRTVYDTPSSAHTARRMNRKHEPGNRAELITHCKSCGVWYLAPSPTTFREVRRASSVVGMA
jgi:hypothetical protein